MLEFLERLLPSGDFMPHGHCYLWTPGIVWLHVVSDGLITPVYYSIPFTLASFIRHRHDLDFRWIFACFALFILACGTKHVLEIWNVWHGNDWLSGGAKALTAAVSIPTAILLVRLLPSALSLPSPAMAQAGVDQPPLECAKVHHAARGRRRGDRLRPDGGRGGLLRARQWNGLRHALRRQTFRRVPAPPPLRGLRWHRESVSRSSSASSIGTAGGCGPTTLSTVAPPSFSPSEVPQDHEQTTLR